MRRAMSAATWTVTGEEKSRDVSAAIVANARRVQESLRVMEEMAKTPGLGLDAEQYRQARFELYTIEKDLTFRDAAPGKNTKAGRALRRYRYGMAERAKPCRNCRGRLSGAGLK